MNQVKANQIVPKQNAPIGHCAGRLDHVCRVAYELGLLLALLVLILVAIGGFATYHANIDKTFDISHVGATVADSGLFQVGEMYPVYRFNADWQEPIGQATAERLTENQVIFRYDPATFRWPMGRQGQITKIENDRVRVNLGSDLKFENGDWLNVFSERSKIATLKIDQVGQKESIAKLVDCVDKASNLKSFMGKTVSEFTIPNQVVVRAPPALGGIEVTVFLLFLGAYFVLWKRWGASPISIIGVKIGATVRPHANLKFIFHALLGIPAIWFISEFALRSLCYLAFVVYDNFVHQPVPIGLTFSFLQSWVFPLAGVLLLLYVSTLFMRKVSPFSLVAKRFAFSGGLFGHSAKDFPEHLTMWLLQITIVYAFGRTLGTFFHENLTQGIAASWPNAREAITVSMGSASIDSFSGLWHEVVYAFTHTPRPQSEDGMFLTIQTGIYNVCILGCMVGYGFSLLGYLWGKRIRNVDFTLAGWLTNAVCYGPLLGVVLWQILPPVVGVDPVVAPSILRTVTFIVAVYLNIIYTLSIWNLGTLFGVMTDKGVRSTGFYSVVRHPSYTLEAIMFVVFFCRGLSSMGQWIAASAFLLIYWLRSEREDQFMSASNPDYLIYKEKVPYKFIPGIY